MPSGREEKKHGWYIVGKVVHAYGTHEKRRNMDGARLEIKAAASWR
jgi:hypothetical protein